MTLEIRIDGFDRINFDAAIRASKVCTAVVFRDHKQTLIQFGLRSMG